MEVLSSVKEVSWISGKILFSSWVEASFVFKLKGKFFFREVVSPNFRKMFFPKLKEFFSALLESLFCEVQVSSFSELLPLFLLWTSGKLFLKTPRKLVSWTSGKCLLFPDLQKSFLPKRQVVYLLEFQGSSFRLIEGIGSAEIQGTFFLDLQRRNFGAELLLKLQRSSI